MRVRTLSAFLSSLTMPGRAAHRRAGRQHRRRRRRRAPPLGHRARDRATAPAIHLSPVTVAAPAASPTRARSTRRRRPAKSSPTRRTAPAPQLTGTTGGSTGRRRHARGSDRAAPATAATPQPQLLVPGSLARYVNGLAAAPMSAPAIGAADDLGGQRDHRPALHLRRRPRFVHLVRLRLLGHRLLRAARRQPADDARGLLGIHALGLPRRRPLDRGVRQRRHAYMDVAGLRLDTSAADDPSNQQGPRWRPLRTGNGGYTVRHPLGL